MTEENITLGTYLRTERERKNIPLEAIARATKITLKNLEALERDEFHLLPPPVFVRGFLRAYAHQVGLDAHKILEMYERQTKDVDSSWLIKKAEGEKKIPRVAKILWPILLIIVLGIILFYSLFNRAPSSTSTPTSPPPAAQVTPEIKIKTPAPTEEPPRTQIVLPEEKKMELPPPSPNLTVTPEKTPSLMAGEKKKERRHVLKLKAIEKTWLRLKADEEKEIEALLQPKETATWTARRQFKITIGNAGGVELTFNGVRQEPLGESGQVVHLVLPPEIKKKVSGEEVEKKD